MTAPSVAIILLNWNGSEDTLECLNSLFDCTYANYHIYVVDNGSTDDSVDMIKTFIAAKSNITIIENGANLGYAGGNNIGMQKAIADGVDYVLLLNNDTLVDAGFIEPLVSAFETDKLLGVVTGKIYFIEPPKKVWFFGGHMDRNTGIGGPCGGQEVDDGQYSNAVECDYVTGCVLMVSRQVIEHIGYLDDDYFYLCEDADYCFRIADAGYRVRAVPNSIVQHKVSASLSDGEDAPVRLYFRSRNRMMLIKKNRKHFSYLRDGIVILSGHVMIVLRRIVKRKSIKGTVFYIWGIFDYLRGRKGNIPFH